MDWPRQRKIGLIFIITGLLLVLMLSLLLGPVVFIGVFGSFLIVIGLLILLDYTDKRLLNRIDRLERLVGGDED